jgi:hypothetical protein
MKIPVKSLCARVMELRQAVARSMLAARQRAAAVIIL